eukprot:4302813-Prymnesium_polylepis.1
MASLDAIRGRRDSASLRGRAMDAAQTRYRLIGFSERASAQWWRHMNWNSPDPRIRIFFFVEEPQTAASIAFSSFITAVILVNLAFMVIDSSERGHRDDYKSSDAIRTTMIACDSIFCVELVLRYVAMCAPLDAQVAHRRRLRLVAWNIIDTLALSSFFYGIDGQNRWELDLFSTLRVMRAIKGISRFPETSLLVQSIWKSARALNISFCILAAQ